MSTPAIDLNEQARCRQSPWRTGIRLAQYQLIVGGLQAAEGNQTRAAEMLGVNLKYFQTVLGKLRACGLVIPAGRTAKHGRRHGVSDMRKGAQAQ